MEKGRLKFSVSSRDEPSRRKWPPPRQSPGPQPPSKRDKIVVLYALVLATSLIWILAIGLAPYFRSRGIDIYSYIYAFFAPVCHQLPNRSFRLFGQPLAVCARCLGIYAGFLGGVIVYPFLRGFSGLELPPIRVFLAMSAPIAVDAAANVFGLWSSPNGVRFATGFVWGSILPIYVLTGLGELWLSKRNRS